MLHRSCLWTWIVWLTILRHASSTAESPPNNLRAQQGERQQQPHPLQPMHRRLYGAESVAVRNEISRLERRMSRYLTGLNPDPNHRVPYENHPYENRQASALRTLTTASSSSTSSNSSSSSSKGASFQPIRIQFETTALDNIRNSTNAAKIDWIKSVILPATAAFWSRTLSVVPVSGNLRISSSQLDSYKYCGDPELTLVPDQDKSTGVANTDLILYVSGSDSSRFCPERTLAVAVPCNFDQFDRPTAGAVNVCLGNIELGSDGTATKEVMDNYIAVTTHEVGHVLGMSSNSYVFFWDPDTGKPRTPRPFTQQTVTCTDGVSRTLSLPAENTLVWGTEYSGAKYAAIVTPKVRAVARNQFDCQSLLGAQLENQDTRPDSCIGDHWDERYFYPESMSAIISPTRNIMSSLTLALLEDSGWYRANYTSTRMSPWGLGVGCDFFQACLLPPSASSTSTTSNSSSSSSSASGTPTIPAYSQGFFCNEGAKKGCSMEHSTKLACTVIDYSYYTPQVLPDTSYQYFPGAPSKGGLRQADYCPVYGTTYNNLDAYQLDCSDPANAPTLNVYRYASVLLCVRHMNL